MAFALKYWRQIGIGILALLLCIYIGSLKVRLGHAQGKVEKLSGELDGCKARYALLETRLQSQTSAVKAISEASDAMKRRGEVKLLEAQKKQAQLEQEKAWIAEQLAKPDRKSKSCAEALRDWRQK
jgi:chromosome segregation ATPase